MVLTLLRDEAPLAEETAPALSVILAVRPIALAGVIEDLLRDLPGVHVLERTLDPAGLVRRSAELRPDLIVASVRVLGRERAAIEAQIRRSSPDSKILLIHSMPGLLHEGKPAIAHVQEGALLRQLLPSVERLTGTGGRQDVKTTRRPRFQ